MVRVWDGHSIFIEVEWVLQRTSTVQSIFLVSILVSLVGQDAGIVPFLPPGYGLRQPLHHMGFHKIRDE